MANDKQFRPRTKYVATRGVTEYRSTIAHLVGPSDSVLEVGSEWGTTTVLLAEMTPCVIGSDVSPVCVERARQSHPHIRFEVLDAFDVLTILKLEIPFSKIYVDLSGLSGYRSTLDLLALLNTYSVVLQPDLIVVKSGALKDLSRRCTPWRGVTQGGPA